jgi:hypothetical protein
VGATDEQIFSRLWKRQLSAESEPIPLDQVDSGVRFDSNQHRFDPASTADETCSPSTGDWYDSGTSLNSALTTQDQSQCIDHSLMLELPSKEGSIAHSAVVRDVTVATEAVMAPPGDADFALVNTVEHQARLMLQRDPLLLDLNPGSVRFGLVHGPLAGLELILIRVGQGWMLQATAEDARQIHLIKQSLPVLKQRFAIRQLGQIGLQWGVEEGCGQR